MAKKSGMPVLPKSEKLKTKVTRRSPKNTMSVGAASAPMDPAMGLRMKKGGSCKGYAKGGSIDGVVTKGKTKGRIV